MQLKSHVFLERSRAANIRSFIAFNLSEGALLPTYCVASCIMCLHCGSRHAPRLFTLGFLNKPVIVVVCNGTGARGQTAAIHIRPPFYTPDSKACGTYGLEEGLCGRLASTSSNYYKPMTVVGAMDVR